MTEHLRKKSIAVLFCLISPIVASAADMPPIQGYCGPPPPNSLFQFSSSTIPDVKAQLIATLTDRAYADYPAAVSGWMASNGGRTRPGPGCVIQLNASDPLPPIVYCWDTLACSVQLNGYVWSSCGSKESDHGIQTFVIERTGCYAGYVTTPKKVIVLDPGHGLNCASVGQAVGAVGVTDFPANDPPPGKLREDYLTLSIAREAQQLLSSKYTVKLTKSDVNSCPTLKERGHIANNANAKVFVSIHINAPNVILGVEVPFGNGTSAVFNPAKSGTEALAAQLATAVSTRLGTNNRGGCGG